MPLDATDLEHALPLDLWEQLYQRPVIASEIPHEALQLMRKMGLARVDNVGTAHLTTHGDTYAALIVRSPF